MTKNPVRTGVLGTFILVVAVVGTLNAKNLPLIGDGPDMTIEFAEAGGLQAGDDVIVSGAQVGKVREVSLHGDVVEARVNISPGSVRLGNETQARIVTVTLLGRAALELVPRGTGELPTNATIPESRTSSPYNITSALSQLTIESAAIDKAQLARALDQVSQTFSQTREDVGPALQGIRRVASAVADNDEALKNLLERSKRVTDVLASRDDQIATLLVSGSSLLQELDDRQRVVESVLRSGQQLASQLQAVLSENDGALGPALTELDTLLATLNRNKDNLQKSITGIRNYTVAFGEAVSSGPFFDAYVQNLTAPASLAPILAGALQ